MVRRREQLAPAATLFAVSSVLHAARYGTGAFGGQRFLNPIPTSVQLKGAGFARILFLFLFENRSLREPRRPLGPFRTNPAAFVEPPESGLRVTWLGHSSVLLEIDGLRLLFDPVWSERASFSKWLGPKRFMPPPLALEDLPALDAIILSHDHYDHLDAETWRVLARLAKTRQTPVLTSLGVGKYLLQCGVERSRITEMDWTEEAMLSNGCKLTCLPSRHFSGRALWNRFGTLWSAFAIRGPRHNVFFGADSGPFDEGFREIGERFGPFDLTLLEIGAYGAQWPEIHMGPDAATRAHLLLRGRIMLPIHWGTFNLALHPWKEPVERVLTFAAERGIDLLLPRPGEPSVMVPQISYWWDVKE